MIVERVALHLHKVNTALLHQSSRVVRARSLAVQYTLSQPSKTGHPYLCFIRGFLSCDCPYCSRYLGYNDVRSARPISNTLEIGSFSHALFDRAYLCNSWMRCRGNTGKTGSNEELVVDFSAAKFNILHPLQSPYQTAQCSSQPIRRQRSICRLIS